MKSTYALDLSTFRGTDVRQSYANEALNRAAPVSIELVSK